LDGVVRPSQAICAPRFATARALAVATIEREAMSYLDVFQRIKSLESAFPLPIDYFTIDMGTFDAATGAFAGRITHSRTDPEPIEHGPHQHPSNPKPHFQGEFWVSTTIDSRWRKTLTRVPAPKVGLVPVLLKFNIKNQGASSWAVVVAGETKTVRAGQSSILINIWDHGSANWSVICPTPEGFVYPEPGEGIDEAGDVPPLWQAYTGRRRDDGLLEIPGLRPEIGAERLHHGPMLVVTEAAAIDAASHALGTDDIGVDQLAMTIVAPGRVGPFVAVPVSVGTSEDGAACRIELRDAGRNDRVVATTVTRLRPVN